MLPAMMARTSFIAHLTKSDPATAARPHAAHSDCGKVAAEETTQPTDEDIKPDGRGVDRADGRG